MKPQTIRLLDWYAIGPLMVWGGAQSHARNRALGSLLMILGVGTMAYNMNNYMQARR